MIPTDMEQMDMEHCSSLQQEEWEVLEVSLGRTSKFDRDSHISQSIYPDCVSTGGVQGLIKLEIPIELPEPRYIVSETIPNVGKVSQSGGTRDFHTNSLQQSSREAWISLSNLPPLLLEILLPQSYPLYTPPEIISLHATRSWLPLSGLQRQLKEMWQRGEGVLYTWIEWIRTGEFLDSLELTISVQGEQII